VTSSSEATYAWRMANFYGRDGVILDRASRVGLLYELIDNVERQMKADREKHAREQTEED
jgi:hypothetical protein